MKLSHCELFHMTEEVQRARMLLCGLSKKELLHAKSLEKWLAPSAHVVSGVLMARMRQLPELDGLLAQEGPTVAAEVVDFLRSFTCDVGAPAWFERRLREGLNWARRGLSWPAYFCLMRFLEEQVVENLREAPERLQHLARKMFTLELAVTSEAFGWVEAEAFGDAVEELQQQLNVETLTKVSTRLHVLAAVDLCLLRMKSGGAGFSVVMADIDFFKRINDDLGHPGGDEVLRQVAQRLREGVRAADVVGRYGGEEFLLVLDDVGAQAACVLADRLRENVASSELEIDGKSVHITLSLGVCAAQKDDSAQNLIARADAALYDAKRRGRNCVVLASDDWERSFSHTSASFHGGAVS